jgi:acyl-coenzyme A synthetase/AMP-(fatty) acid ligase
MVVRVKCRQAAVLSARQELGPAAATKEDGVLYMKQMGHNQAVVMYATLATGCTHAPCARHLLAYKLESLRIRRGGVSTLAASSRAVCCLACN